MKKEWSWKEWFEYKEENIWKQQVCPICEGPLYRDGVRDVNGDIITCKEDHFWSGWWYPQVFIHNICGKIIYANYNEPTTTMGKVLADLRWNSGDYNEEWKFIKELAQLINNGSLK